MAESINRDIATSISAAVKADNITSSGEVGASIQVLDSAGLLPTSGVSAGERAFTSDSNGYYIHNGSGWFQIGLINTNPSITAVNDSDGNAFASGFALSKTGTPVRVTITATDPENVPIVFSVVSDAGFDSMATVSQDGQVFTITPMSEDSAVTKSGNLTFRASDGVNVATAVREFTLTFIVEASKSTRLHLKSVGNDKTNTTFTDSSTHSHTSTKYGDVYNQFYTPHHPGGYSVGFDGNGDRITCGSTRTVPSTAFTVTAWVYFRDTTPCAVWGQGTSGNVGRTGIGINNSSTSWFAQIGGTNVGSGTYVPRANQWYYTDLQWDGSTLKFFVDGLLIGSGSTSQAPENTTMTIGNLADAWSTNYPLNGFVRDVKVVSGTPAGSSTVPTVAATVTTGTQLLACNLPYIKDASSNNVTLTQSGNPTMRRFAPFDFTASPSSDGSSAYFDGTASGLATGDYLAFAETADNAFTFGTGDLTVEAWVYPTSAPGVYQTLISTAEPTDFQGIWFGISDTNNLHVIGGNGSSWTLNALSGGYIPAKQWTHVAYVRSGNTHTSYVNGVQADTETNSVSYGNTNNAIVIGGRQDTGSNTQYFPGFMSDVRVVKGTAVYTSNFTPPTAPLTAITNTSLLTCNDAPDIYDTSGTNRVLLTNSATNTTGTENQYGSSVDLGATDTVYFYTPDGEDFQDLDDFTVEFWMHLDGSNVSYPYPFILRDDSNTTGPRLQIRFGDSGYGYHLQFQINGSGSTNVWNVNLTQSNFTGTIKHLAVSRKNGYIGVWVNGTRYNVATGVDPTSFTQNYINYNSTITNLDRMNLGGSTFNGQIEDFRLTVGEQARYPYQMLRKNFESDSNTKLLTGIGDTIVDSGPDTQTITTSGAVVSDFGPAPGMKSIFFDGSNDYLRCDAALDSFTSTSSTFTLEAWVYWLTAPSGFETVFGVNRASGGTNQVLLGQKNSAWIGVWDNGSDLVGRSFNTHQWYHVAVQYNSSSNFEFWVNGGRTGLISNDTTGTALSACTFLVGTEADASNAGSLGNYFNGYMSNIRVSSGARYGHNFTAPTSALEG